MTDYQPDRLIAILKSCATLAPGLTDNEIEDIQTRYRFQFPPDLRALLSVFLPISPGFVNWRDDADEKIQERMDWPMEGVCFDVEHNSFWLDDWGKRPESLEDALNIARTEVRRAPTLIPILSHRYLPSEPLLAGNPVLSVYQTDIIYYGYDLESYFATEFKMGDPLPNDYIISPEAAARSPRPIRLWDILLQANGYSQ